MTTRLHTEITGAAVTDATAKALFSAENYAALESGEPHSLSFDEIMLAADEVLGTDEEAQDYLRANGGGWTFDAALESYWTPASSRESVAGAGDKPRRMQSQSIGDRTEIEEDEADEITYTVSIGSWNGACYECVENHDFATLEEAEKFAGETEDGDWGESYDLEVTIADSEGEEISTLSFERSEQQEAQNEYTVLVEDEGEFSTSYIGVKDKEFARWDRNGGSRGAHDRMDMDGSGRWIETYDAPEGITAEEAIEAMPGNVEESIDAICEASDWDADDLIREAGTCRLGIGNYDGIWEICGQLIGIVGVSHITYLDDKDEAMEFAADNWAGEFIKRAWKE